MVLLLVLLQPNNTRDSYTRSSRVLYYTLVVHVRVPITALIVQLGLQTSAVCGLHMYMYIHVVQPIMGNICKTIAELEALAEIIGPYGIRFMGEKLMDQVSGQVKEIKKLVVLNQDTLLALHTNRDKPEIFNEVMRKVKRNFFYAMCMCASQL